MENIHVSSAKKLIYLSNKDYVRDLLLFLICANNKIKTLSIEKLINYEKVKNVKNKNMEI